MVKLHTKNKIKNEIDRLLLFLKHDRSLAKTIMTKDFFKFLSKINPEFRKEYEKYFQKYEMDMQKPKMTIFGGIKYFHRIRDLETLWEIFSLKDYNLVESFVPKKDDIIIEGGAGIGEYTMITAQLIGNNGKIISVEPNKDSFAFLKKNIKLNKKKNVIPVNAAIGNKNGKIKIFSIPGTSIIDSVSPEWAGTRNFYLVNSITIDNLMGKLKLKKLDMIKLDIEGAEYLALLGTVKTLKKFRPKFIIEVHSKKLVEQITEFMKKENYKIELEKVKNTLPFISLIYASYKGEKQNAV